MTGNLQQKKKKKVFFLRKKKKETLNRILFDILMVNFSFLFCFPHKQNRNVMLHEIYFCRRKSRKFFWRSYFSISINSSVYVIHYKRHKLHIIEIIIWKIFHLKYLWNLFYWSKNWFAFVFELRNSTEVYKIIEIIYKYR